MSLLSLEDTSGVEVAKNLEILLNLAALDLNSSFFYVSSRNLASFDRYHMAYIHYKTYMSNRKYDHQILI